MPDPLVHEMVTVLPLTEAVTSVGVPGVPAGTEPVDVGAWVVVVVDAGAVVVVVVDAGALVVVVVDAGALVVVVVDAGAAVVVVVDEPRLAPVAPPKSVRKAARALGKSPLVMSLSCPPAVSLNEKMSVKATLLVEIQLANWLMK